MSEPILFEDTFTITSLNSAKYERVSRISGVSTNNPSSSSSSQHQPIDIDIDLDDEQQQDAGHRHLNANSTTFTLDVNTELYPLKVGERIQIGLALSLNVDGGGDLGGDDGGRGSSGSRGGAVGWRDVSSGEKRTLADEYDYVCYGKIYRFEEGSGDDIRVFVSFGGLLLYLEGPYSKLNPLRIDHVYLLMKR